jgi:signal peptidase I
LPRRQQEKIIEFVTAYVRQYQQSRQWSVVMRRSYIKPIAIVTIGVIIIVTLAFLLSTLPSVQLLRVQGKDMEPTLHEGDRILVTKRIEQLRRGDIVIFLYPADPSKSFIKRVVGLPGELIEISDGKVLVNGQVLQENYLDAQLNRFPYKASPRRIPEGRYYVMGDNRDNSNDSRFWGPLPKDLIQSKVLFHY